MFGALKTEFTIVISITCHFHIFRIDKPMLAKFSLLFSSPIFAQRVKINRIYQRMESVNNATNRKKQAFFSLSFRGSDSSYSIYVE